MPSRRIPPNGRSLTGKIYSRKLKRSVSYESTLERDVIQLLDFDPGVLSFEEQPASIIYKHTNGESIPYTADFRIEFSALDEHKNKLSPLILEVKPIDILHTQHDKLLPKFLAAKEYTSLRRWRFNIATESEIRTDYLNNVKFLSRFSINQQNKQSIQYTILNGFNRTGRSCQDLLLAPFDKKSDLYKELYCCLWEMVAIGILKVDLNSAITNTSLIWTERKLHPYTPFPQSVCLWKFLSTPLN